MWKLSIEDDQGERTVVNLVRDDYSIGRAEDNTIRLTERNISRHHARIVRQGDSWFLEDQRSYNGAYVNGVRISGRQELAHGDLVQLGDYRVEVNDEALDTREQGHRLITQPSLPRRDTLTGQPDRFVMLIGPSQGAEFALEGERLMIGRGEECDLCIEHASVSRVHAEVRRVGDGRYELVDKGSANGVRVNGADMQRALLDARDVVELGDVVLKYIPRGQIFRADAEESQRLPALSSIPSSKGRRHGGSFGTKVMVAAACALIGCVLVVFVVRQRAQGASVTRHAAVASPADQERMILDEAVRMDAEGNVFAAHDHLKQISADSDLRKHPEFQSIESGWADTMLQAALTETEPSKKRAILDQVAGAADVDGERRQKAAAALSALASAAVDVAELPASAEAGDAEPTATEAPSGSAASKAKPKATLRAASTKKSGSRIVLEDDEPPGE